MAETITITLPRDFLGQIVDGLNVLIEQWQATAECLETGYADGETIIRECSDADEAQKLAEYYSQIRDHLLTQVPQE